MGSDLGSSFEENRAELRILRNGKIVTILRGKQASEFVSKVSALSNHDQQQLMARVTGNYKRGNERLAKKHRKHR